MYIKIEIQPKLSIILLSLFTKIMFFYKKTLCKKSTYLHKYNKIIVLSIDK